MVKCRYSNLDLNLLPSGEDWGPYLQCWNPAAFGLRFLQARPFPRLGVGCFETKIDPVRDEEGDGDMGTGYVIPELRLWLPHMDMIDPNDPNKFQAVETVTIRSGLSGSALDAAGAHEGSHVADAQGFVATITMQGDFDVSKNLTSYQSELRAYMVTNSVLTAGNAKLGYGDCGLSGKCVLGAGIASPQAVQTINQLLANPANRYGIAPNYGVIPANQGPRLYPSLTTPR
jgi:hypothetical protein